MVSTGDSPKNEKSKVIRLNVGGSHYEVSRFLMEMYPETMLARLVSDEWSGENDQEVFIDRNGLRFQYVLDYMRDQKTTLAMNINKESILTELDYFGFIDVPPESIDEKISNTQAQGHIEATQIEFAKRVKRMQEDWMLNKIASMVYDAQFRSKTSYCDPIAPRNLTLCEKDLKEVDYASSLMRQDGEPAKSGLNKVLSEYGLCVLSISSSYKKQVGMTIEITFRFGTTD
jgi:hypothetical protein